MHHETLRHFGFLTVSLEVVFRGKCFVFGFKVRVAAVCVNPPLVILAIVVYLVRLNVLFVGYILSNNALMYNSP